MTVSTLTLPSARSSWLAGFARHRLVWCAVLALLLALRNHLADPGRVAASFGDPDDALRLLQIRNFLQGAGWYDLLVTNIGGPDGLLSHWSRLVDLPLAGLIAAFSLAFDRDTAELVVRHLWPTLLLTALLWLVAREAARRAGEPAFWLALVMAAVTPMALAQFQIGRIDHHNVMILATVAGLLMLARTADEAWAGRAAGLALGLGLAVGLEALALVAVSIGAAVLVAVIYPNARDGVRTASLWLAAAVVIGFLINVPPSRYLDVRCDAISLNLIALVAFGAVTVAAVDRYASGVGYLARIGLLAAGAGLGLAAYAAIEPACLTSPFGRVNPLIHPVWHDGVRESFNLWRFANGHPAIAIGYIVMMVAAVAMAFRAWRQSPQAGALLVLALMVLAALYGVLFVKLMPYASWLAVVVLATAIARLPAMGGQPRRTVQLGALILVNPSTAMALTAVLVSLTTWIGFAPPVPAQAQSAGCDSRAGIRTLAGLPNGLFVTDIDLGALIVIDTSHSAFAAPYHRLDRQIIAADAILTGPATSAAAALGAVGARYAAVCGGTTDATAPVTLRAAMTSGAVIPGLERVALPSAAGGLIVYRLATR